MRYCIRWRFILPSLFLVVAAQSARAQTIALTSNPPGARMYMTARGIRTLIGTGTARIKLEKESDNEVTTELEGYAPRVDRFPKGQKYPKELTLTLNVRLVKVTALPYDAKLYLNGRVVGSQSAEITIPDGTTATLELKKPGFKPVTRTYKNVAGGDVPPVTENLELTDRLVSVLSQPAEASIQVDGQQEQKGSADVVIPKGKCVTARAVLTGFKPAEQTFCNKEEQPDSRMSGTLVLTDRVTVLRASPAGSQIWVNGKVVGTGEFTVTVPNESCVKVAVFADGFITQRKQYCNEVNMKPPVDDNVQLAQDEAYNAAAASDQANTNVTIEVSPTKTPDAAWRLLSQIVMDKFDVLEITDKDTGYLRTAWQVAGFNGSTVRTRVIIKLGGTQPLKYVVKLASEHADGTVSVKNDEDFKEWPRIMLKYKDLITEMQSRLR
jgi:hypothetical protein